MGAFEDKVRGVLSDTMNLPDDFLSMIPQYVAQNPVPLARTSGTRIASGTNASTVATTGTTFGTGADLLASPLTFTADGKTDYLLRVSAVGWSINAGTNWLYMHANLDGADAGLIAQEWSDTATGFHRLFVGGVLLKPSSGSHTVNARVRTGGAYTLTVTGGAGGVGASTPIFVSLEVA